MRTPGQSAARNERSAAPDRSGAALTRLILRCLRRAYGPRPWKCWGKGVDVLVDTILSQNTSNKNSDAGYRQLRRRFRSWSLVADAPVAEVERHIRVSGLSNQKAPRIQAILRQIKADRGRMDIQHLAEIDEQLAYDYLTKFKGVGPKTANCVLLFAFKHAVFPVDTHIHRIARRLKLIGAKTTAEQAHDLLKPMIPPQDRYEMHVLLIEHGRRTCRAINPKCDECPLLDLCPYGQERVRGARPRATSTGRAGSAR
jgi:endonuclease-3